MSPYQSALHQIGLPSFWNSLPACQRSESKRQRSCSVHRANLLAYVAKTGRVTNRDAAEAIGVNLKSLANLATGLVVAGHIHRQRIGDTTWLILGSEPK